MSGWRGAPPPFYPSAGHTALDRCTLSEIVPAQLYLTNFKGAADIEELKRLKVTHVASVGDEFDKNGPAENGLVYWSKDITDDEGQRDVMASSLREGAGFIDMAIRGGGTVVCHCAAGISRSACVVLGYMIVHGGKTLLEALRQTIERRPCIWPNDGFMSALVELEKEVRSECTLTSEEYEHWGDYDGPEEGGGGDVGGGGGAPPPLPRLVRDDTCMEDELAAIEAEERAAADEQKRRQLLAMLGDSTDEAIGGDVAALAAAAAAAGPVVRGSQEVGVVRGSQEGPVVRVSQLPHGDFRGSLTKQDRKEAALRASCEARAANAAPLSQPTTTVAAAAVPAEAVGAEEAPALGRKRTSSGLVGGALNRIKRLWPSNKKNAPVQAAAGGSADAGAGGEQPAAATTKKQGQPKKGKKKAQRTATVKPE